MKTDLILVSYNSKADLERFLPSIRENTKDYTLNIVDNGSGEETQKYLEDCDVSVTLQENRGYAAACNEGAKATPSEFIVFLNCDLLATPNWLEELLKPFEDPKVAVTGARLFSTELAEYPTPQEGWACGACFAVRRKVFEELGGFDENFFLFFEETDLCERAKKAGYKIVRSEAKLIHYHPHFPPFPPELQKHWDKSKVYFEKKHGPLKQKQDLALVMIVKNEEGGLERAIRSCQDFVSEIVIAVDNASTDRTEEIAKKYATTIKHFDWHDDFSETRNFAHQGVKTKWILFLDGHEYVAKALDLGKHLQSKHDGLMCAIEMENGMIFGNPRIYRNGVQFAGKIHERQQCRSTEPYPEFLIKHDRVMGQAPEAAAEREKQRDDQVPRIMGALFKKDKKNLRASFHLALYTQSRGDQKGAIRWWKRYLKYSRNREERWYAFFNTALCQLGLGHLFRALWYANQAETETPGRWEIQKLKGLIFFNRKKFEAAADYFVASFAPNTGPVSYLPWKRDRAGVYNMIGECLFNLGVYDRAALAFDQAAKTCEDKKFRELLEARAKLMAEIAKSCAKS